MIVTVGGTVGIGGVGSCIDVMAVRHHLYLTLVGAVEQAGTEGLEVGVVQGALEALQSPARRC